MELKETAIIFINAFALVLGYSFALNSMLYAISREKEPFCRLFVVLYIAAIIMSIIAVTYVPTVLFIVSIIYLCLKKRKKWHVAVAAIFAIAVLIVVMAINNFISIVLKIPIDKLFELRATFSYNLYNSSIFVVLSVAISVITESISKRIHRVNLMGSINESYINVKLIVFIVISIAFFVFVIATIWMLGLIDIERAVFYTTFAIIISLLLSIFILFAIYTIISITIQKKREFEVKRDKEITELYKNEIQNIYENIRDFKHDYMKIYSSMSILINENRMDELKKFFWDEITPMQKGIINEANTTQVVTQIEDGIVQGIVYNYIVKARNKGIDFIVVINKEIPQIGSLPSIELSRLLGIILDNAMEETYKIKAADRKKVIMSINADCERVIYKVKNTYVIKPDLSKILAGNYSTKGEGHGRGIAIAKKIIDKYKDAFLQIKLEENFFVVEVNLAL